MGDTSSPIRIDRELDASARAAAKVMSRSVAEQVSHWARLGRELERSPDVSVADVRAVISGQRIYDRLTAPEQAIVRTQWGEQLAKRLSTLNLASEFESEAHSYAELDDRGQLRIVRPARKP